ncbi:hypothetical protein K503DRAFT_318593 [Rhizopogon vinicolor AM-OR11-026]|uniref:Uncharacterized protein n=1 Tax=Rhizopogon vinicolor AM-OR11-026 TaxID=1314800 RepID=A0A1B7MUE3_9AGAM|nr:hypothetical protein K503DRAFT_318593 [Rhizopogon vinicolor AM-OR11-026]
MNICSLLKSFGKYNYILRHNTAPDLQKNSAASKMPRPSKKARAGVKNLGFYAIKKSPRRSFVHEKENNIDPRHVPHPQLTDMTLGPYRVPLSDVQVSSTFEQMLPSPYKCPNFARNSLSKRGFQVIILPKFHCELSFIEQCRCYAKRLYRLYPLTKRENEMEVDVHKALDAVPTPN